LWLTCVCGCRSSGQDVSAFRSPLEEGASIDGVMGPTERRLRGADWEKRRGEIASSGMSLEGLEEYEAAQKLYDAGEFRASERAFKQLARDRSRAGTSWQDRWREIFARTKPTGTGAFGSFGDPIEEDSLFMVAESQFAQKKFSWAQDSYSGLLEKYPSTRHLDTVTRRLFHIARDWLGVPDTAGDDEQVRLVSHAEDGTDSPAMEAVQGPTRWPIVPNLFDRAQPVFDTDGRALQALEAIWQHDATGPLADDALMLQATHYQRKGDYVEASRLYALVREQYPDSPHFQDAFILGSHVTLASYSGPTYDDATLQEAKLLKEQARRLFPDLSNEQRQRLEDELARIRDAEVEREWANVEFYLRKNQPASVALYCNQIINRYPDSKYAKQAWEVLQRLQQEQEGFRLWSFNRAGRNPGDSAGAAHRQTPAADVSEPAEPDPTVDDVTPAPQRRTWWQRLRPVEKPPDLQAVEPGKATLDASETSAAAEDERPARVTLD
jgi:outer membrane protein assembly factor BamD (BamD/ComL family)